MRPNIARLAIVACLTLATTAYGTLEKQVTLTIEGKPVAVKTHGGTVADILARQGVEIGPKDVVRPSPATPVVDGQSIEVRFAKPVTILLDGKPRRVIVTGLTIEEVLAEIELRGSRADRVHPSRSASVTAGMTITYARARAVEVHYDDKSERVVTDARTVGQVVRELGVKMGKRDQLRPKASTPVRQGMDIRIVRVGLRREVITNTLPYQTILRRDADLEVGERKQIQDGRSGIERVKYLTRYVDGEPVARRVLDRTLIRAPRNRIIAIGAGSPGCSCDRGTQVGKATWYSQADGLTAAHRTLPFGTVVRVVNRANGKSVNVTIRDRGPYGDDRIIDLSDEAFRRIAPLSTGVVNVKIYW